MRRAIKSEAIHSTAATAIRVASADVVPARRPTDRLQPAPVRDGGPKANAQPLAMSSPAFWEFLEYEQGGGI
jgi:hypothetical protein